MAMMFLQTSAGLFGAEITHTNIGRVELSDQSFAAQQQAGKQALAQVLVKISGDRSVLSHPSIERTIANHEQYLIASSFVQIDNRLIFEATFNQSKIENLLLAIDSPVWPNLRPNALVWLGVSEASLRNLTVLYNDHQPSTSSQENMVNVIQFKAFKRGIDLLFPIGDFEDKTSVSNYDLWGQNISLISDYSLRYGSDFIIIGVLEPYTQQDHEQNLRDPNRVRTPSADQDIENQPLVSADDFIDQDTNINNSVQSTIDSIDNTSIEENSLALIVDDLETQSELMNQAHLSESESLNLFDIQDLMIPEDTQFKIDFVITNRRDVKTGSVYGTNQVETLNKLVDSYADYLAQQYSLNTDTLKQESEKISINVSGITSLQDYVELMTLLESIPAIESVVLERQNASVSTLSIKQSISIQRLNQILLFDGRLQLSADTELTRLEYEWQGR